MKQHIVQKNILGVCDVSKGMDLWVWLLSEEEKALDCCHLLMFTSYCSTDVPLLPTLV